MPSVLCATHQPKPKINPQIKLVPHCPERGAMTKSGMMLQAKNGMATPAITKVLRLILEAYRR